jgi:hypothetical protein
MIFDYDSGGCLLAVRRQPISTTMSRISVGSMRSSGLVTYPVQRSSQFVRDTTKEFSMERKGRSNMSSAYLDMNRLFALSAKSIRRLRTADKIITPTKSAPERQSKGGVYLLHANMTVRDLPAASFPSQSLSHCSTNHFYSRNVWSDPMHCTHIIRQKASCQR